MTDCLAQCLAQPPDRATLQPCDTDARQEPSCCKILDNLYRRERAGLLAYLSRRVGHENAGDLVQEVFLRAATSPQLADLKNPGGFLHRIARNLLIDEARRRKCGIVTLPLIEDVDAPCCANQEHDMHAEESSRLLEEALAALPSKTARIYAMHRFEEKSYRQIHLELGIALPTVDYHMMKALAHLRGALADDRGAGAALLPHPQK